MVIELQDARANLSKALLYALGDSDEATNVLDALDAYFDARAPARGASEDTIERIYQHVDAMLRRGEFAGVDAMLRCVDLSWPTVDLLAYVSITHAAAGLLKEYRPFVARVRAELTTREPDRVNDLMQGFDLTHSGD
jgi:hypothetical protein